VIDSIKNTTSAGASSRAQSVSQTSGLRNNAVVLDAIVQTQQKASGATARVNTALAVPQSAKSGNSGSVKLPRGSLVDVLA
jgi:hypothetical protein